MPEHNPDAEPRESRSEVLVVDDDEKNLTAIAALLGRLDVDLTMAHTGEAALRHLLDHDYAAILLDVNLPGLSGFETARLIRGRDRSAHVPILFITGYSSDDADIRRGYALGAVDYLFKPIVPEVLLAKVQVFVDLRNRTIEVERQAERLREAERKAAERRLEEERARWEAEDLRRQIAYQRQRNEALRENDRRKDDFIALMGHELRNPLVPIVVGLRLIEHAGCDDPIIVEARTRMQRQVQHLARMVDDLLDIGRINQGKLELQRAPVDFRDVVDEARDACRSRIEDRRQTLRVEGPDHPVRLSADATRLTQVLANLLTNASRYSEPEREIRLVWGERDGELVVRVIDEGRGIDPEYVEHIFDPFSQERKGGVGLGLGLALVRALVEGHGGRIEVHSDGVGKGAEFVVRLPMGVAVSPDVPVPRRRRDPSETASPRRVVLIEDQVDIQELVARLIEAWGHEVVGVAGTAMDGIDVVRRARPDVVVVDIGLPDRDGYYVAECLRADLDAGVPRLLALSGYGQQRDLAASRAAGFAEHLVKPPDPEDLRAAIEGRFSALEVAQ